MIKHQVENQWGTPCVAATQLVAEDCPEACGACTAASAGCGDDVFYMKKDEEVADVPLFAREIPAGSGPVPDAIAGCIGLVICFTLFTVARVRSSLRERRWASAGVRDLAHGADDWDGEVE